MGTLELPAGCKPSKACSTDETRPTLCHGYLVKRDDGVWLCATDSYIAVALRVAGPSSDLTEGWVPITVLRHLEEQDYPAKAEQISTTAWRFSVDDVTVTHDLDKLPGSYPPNIANIGMWDDEPGIALDSICLAPGLTARIGEALGAGHMGGLRYTFTRPLGAVRLRDPRDLGRRALQMPVRLEV